jgi:hypothetical protein
MTAHPRHDEERDDDERAGDPEAPQQHETTIYRRGTGY